MNAIKSAAREFLAQKRIAVAGVSRSGDLPANFIYRKLRDAGYEVYAVNPGAEQVEGDRCFHSIAGVPAALDGVVIATPPSAARSIVEECVARGVRRVWMHRSFGAGSVDEDAAQFGAEMGLSVIPDGCPMMFLEPVDAAHVCMRFITGVLRRGPAAAATKSYLDSIGGS